AGILMHISSLPGKYGVGNLGRSAYDFADKLSEMGIAAWQVLPVGPTDGFNSPYASLSAFAGNPAFIDPETLFEEGLLTKEELKACEVDSPYVADYASVSEWLMPTLRKAYGRADKALMKKVKAFAEENDWLPDYALFRALKNKHGQEVIWTDWDKELRLRKPAAMKKAVSELKDDVDFYCFVQYEFYKQWLALKAYANKKGVSIIGDMPIYLNLDSADIWANPDQFSLSDDLRQKTCAGVPPDYFCEDGQKWGNPLYDWAAMKKDGYSWWVRRIENSLRLYDAVRIDHFRGFSAYWEVPIDKSARYGKWRKGPGMDLFRTLAKAHPGAAIIAEDLGAEDEAVPKLLKSAGFPGMAVMQFGFIDNNDNTHLPHNYTKNTVAYTGTHDNNTMMGWLWEASDGERRYALDYCGFKGDWGVGGTDSPVIRSIMRTLWRSGALLTIVPIQDLCGYGGDTRMNRPGVADGNWAFRVPQSELNKLDSGFIRGITELYRRRNPLIKES
ncbi:MAG: 4-alpha-glucanotransferase, partial [Oscillospiraceae bacterium]|nr:4-alpha-glucanotransferase [Oscillospiraceae bacterium]